MWKGPLPDGWATMRGRSTITHVIWPFLGAAFMAFIGLYSIPTFDNITLAIGIGGLAIGIVPLTFAWMRQRAMRA